VGEAAWSLPVALGIGILLGVERERHKGRGPGRGTAGVRTFALAALLGALAWALQPAVLAVAVAFVGAATVAGYARSTREDPGLTTEVALVVTVLLGALTVDEPALSAAAAVVVAMLLAWRGRLHHLARDTLTDQEVHDALLFAAAALIVLPLVPDHGIGPEEVLDPRMVWRLVVLVMAVSGLAYMALRVFGPRRGLPLAGFLGGFVSGAATVGAMAARARSDPQVHGPAVAGAVVATVTTVLLTTFVVGAISAPALAAVGPALAAAGVAAVGYTVLQVRRDRAPHEAGAIDLGRAFDLKAPVLLALTVSAVLLGSAILRDSLGDSGVVLAAGLAGFADAQAAAGSAAALVASGRLEADAAALPVLVAFTTNSVTKTVLALMLGGPRFAARVGAGLVLVVAAAWAGWLVLG
jgi:uncharacterized membrane protein (DUF4010 family)